MKSMQVNKSSDKIETSLGFGSQTVQEEDPDWLKTGGAHEVSLAYMIRHTLIRDMELTGDWVSQFVCLSTLYRCLVGLATRF